MPIKDSDSESSLYSQDSLPIAPGDLYDERAAFDRARVKQRRNALTLSSLERGGDLAHKCQEKQGKYGKQKRNNKSQRCRLSPKVYPLAQTSMVI